MRSVAVDRLTSAPVLHVSWTWIVIMVFTHGFWAIVRGAIPLVFQARDRQGGVRAWPRAGAVPNNKNKR
jgi:hypothetical protein